jgi:hypothetical protein
VGGKICPRQAAIAEFAGSAEAGKPVFIGFFALARRLLMNLHELSAAIGAALLEFRHVICSGRCIIGH